MAKNEILFLYAKTNRGSIVIVEIISYIAKEKIKKGCFI